MPFEYSFEFDSFAIESLRNTTSDDGGDPSIWGRCGGITSKTVQRKLPVHAITALRHSIRTRPIAREDAVAPAPRHAPVPCSSKSAARPRARAVGGRAHRAAARI